MKRKVVHLFIASFLLLGVGLGCSEDFDPFTDVTKLRVLAIQVEPAELSPGEMGQLESLVVEPSGSDISYQWSWCPVVTNAFTGHECPVDEQMLFRLLEAQAESATGVSLQIPGGISLFDLGTGSSAVFPFLIDGSILSAVCQQVVAQMGDQLPFLPDCNGKMITSIKLKVSDGVDEVTAVKELPLLLNDDLDANQNPTLGDVVAIRESARIFLDENMFTPLEASTGYDIEVTVPPQSSESFVSESIETGAPIVEQESLFMTWFITYGDTEFGRTSYIPNETPFEKIQQNNWALPSAAESNGTATLYVVLQDERGGVSWAVRSVSL